MDLRVAAPVVVIIAFTFFGFGFFLNDLTAGPAAVVAPPTTDDAADQGAGPTAQPAVRPSGDCDAMRIDHSKDLIEWSGTNPQRMYAKEAYKFNYFLHGEVERHGIAIERPGASNEDCFQDRFFCVWDGVSDREGHESAGIPADPYGDSRVHYGLPAFTMPEREKEPGMVDWPVEAFRYVAYAITADGDYVVTPLDGATPGVGIVEVRYHTKTNNWGFGTTHCDPFAAGALSE